MKIGLVSLFPEIFAALDYGVIGRALKHNKLSLTHVNPRDFSDHRHGQVDDRPYGGGPGMILQAPPWTRAVLHAKQQLGADTPVIALCPQGQVFKQKTAQALSGEPDLILVCGRYEGFDQRFLDTMVDLKLSVGDYVLSGGEIAAVVVIDAMIRLQPGVLGDAASAAQDSFATELLDHPHYTRPQEFSGISVPDVLLSGDHDAIARWRRQQALENTWHKRPDLLSDCELSDDEQRVITELRAKHQRDRR